MVVIRKFLNVLDTGLNVFLQNLDLVEPSLIILSCSGRTRAFCIASIVIILELPKWSLSILQSQRLISRSHTRSATLGSKSIRVVSDIGWVRWDSSWVVVAFRVVTHQLTHSDHTSFLARNVLKCFHHVPFYFIDLRLKNLFETHFKVFRNIRWNCFFLWQVINDVLLFLGY